MRELWLLLSQRRASCCREQQEYEYRSFHRGRVAEVAVKEEGGAVGANEKETSFQM